MKKLILDFLREEEGLAMVEFTIAGFLLSPIVMTAFTLFLNV
jgi:Flp pilus assembly pilin Flp